MGANVTRDVKKRKKKRKEGKVKDIRRTEMVRRSNRVAIARVQVLCQGDRGMEEGLKRRYTLTSNNRNSNAWFLVAKTFPLIKLI